MNEERAISVFRYALAVAARDDDLYRRQLGPIHLLKYAYLVDMEYARYHDGETFTGIEWIFHSFGPWSVAANALIASAMSLFGIQERRIQSDYSDDDYLRWSMDQQVAVSRDIGSDLPVEVRGTLENIVRRYGYDTSSLLHYVYATPPLLHAAPGEKLDFSTMTRPIQEPCDVFIPMMERLSKKQKKEFAERMSALRTSFDLRQSKVKQQGSYESVDDDFSETASWVNSLAGDSFPSDDVKVEFDNSVWKSETRLGHVIS